MSRLMKILAIIMVMAMIEDQDTVAWTTKKDLNLFTQGDTVEISILGKPTVLDLYAPITVPDRTNMKTQINKLKSKMSELTNLKIFDHKKDERRVQFGKELLEKSLEQIDYMADNYDRIAEFSDSAGPARAVDEGCAVTVPRPKVKETIDSIVTFILSLKNVLEPNSKTIGTPSPPDDSKIVAMLNEIVNKAETIQSHAEKAWTDSESRLAMFNSLTNSIIPGQLLNLIDTAECIKSAQLEKTEVAECTKTSTGLRCNIEISQDSESTHKSHLISIPFFHNNVLYAIDFGSKNPIFTPNVALIGDLEECKTDNGRHECPKSFKLLPNECLENLLALNLNKVIATCKVSRVKLNDKPLIIQNTQGILIAQRSKTPVVVQIGNNGVTQDPVLIQTNSLVTISYGKSGERELIQGATDSDITIVHECYYNTTALQKLWKGKNIDYRDFVQLLPDPVQEILLITGLVVQLIFSIPFVIFCKRECKARISSFNWINKNARVPKVDPEGPENEQFVEDTEPRHVSFNMHRLMRLSRNLQEATQ